MFRCLLLLLMTGGVSPHKLKVADPFEKRSRMVLYDGNIVFHAAQNRNISFLTSGNASIFIGDVDIGHLPDIAAVNELSHTLDAHTTLISNTVNILKSFASRQVDDHKLLQDQTIKITNLTSKLSQIETELRQNTQTNLRQRRMIGRIFTVIRKYDEQSKANACESRPCQGGGTCIRHWGSQYTCLCPEHRTGAQCEVGVDECAMYGGTTAGCQNNATCKNTDVGMECECTSGFFGPLCTEKSNSCDTNPCVEGHCIHVGHDRPHVCICKTGYHVIHELTNPTCVDINECTSNPCHPGIECVNLPGSFKCSGCPPGYEGNGINCVDIDECTRHNPCSKNPPVRCINTVGSYHCGGCPPGFDGDGYKCKRLRACDANPCHPLATCRENNGDMINSDTAGGYACFCPKGYIGKGVGTNGCEEGNGTACDNHDCLNDADCVSISNTEYQCKCEYGYTGSRCESASACLGLPCKNGATCRSLSGRRYECDCPHGFYGENCENQEDGCGTHFRNVTGAVAYPEQFPNQDGRQSCDMIIDPPNLEDQSLDIIFNSFGGMGMTEDGPTDCSKTTASLILYDGTTDRSPIIATYCGDGAASLGPTISHPIKFSSSRGMIRHRGKAGTFKFRWYLTARACFSHSTGQHGIIKYGGQEDSEYKRCTWSITAPRSIDYIELEIPAIDMRSNTTMNCLMNVLEIYSGLHDNAADKIHWMCQSTVTGTTLRTNSPSALVVFTLRALPIKMAPQSEFVIRWKAVESDHSCGGDLIWDGKERFAGTLETPNYPSRYQKGAKCFWKIVKTASAHNETSFFNIKLTFNDFDVPDPYVGIPFNGRQFSADELQLGDFRSFDLSEMRLRRDIDYSRIYQPGLRRRVSFNTCVNDFFKVEVDGAETLRVCNTKRPQKEIYIPSDSAMISFQSVNGVGKGFSIDYEMVCGRKFTDPAGVIQSFNYPNKANGQFVCDYTIVAPASHAVFITFKYIGLQAYNPGECYMLKDNTETKDYIEISGLSTMNATYAQRFLCARYPLIPRNRLVSSGGHPINIRYATSGHLRNTGFLIEYNTTDIGCGGMYTYAGKIKSPNFPEKYLPFMHCVYQINTLWSKRIKLSFQTIDLESSNSPNVGCVNDKIEVYTSYVNENTKGTLIGTFCGMLTPPPIMSVANQMAIVFKSDRSVAGSGFFATFETIDDTFDCDHTYTASSGTLFFNGTSSVNPECDYHINIDQGHKILLTINSISMPCFKGSLKMRNGIDLQSPGFPLLGPDSDICDERFFSGQLRSHSNRVFLQLKGLDLRTVSFNISYEQITGGCGGLVEGFAGSLAAPQYPLKESRAMDCSWKIAAPEGNRIRLTISLLDDLASSDDNNFCGMFANNALNIYDGNTQSDATLIRRFCSRLSGDTSVTSSDNSLIVEYKQGITRPVFGFFAHFRTECNDLVFTDFSGSIQSPGYPNPVGERRYCKWTIRVSPGSKVKVFFHHFEMEKKMNTYSICDENSLTINKEQMGDALVKNVTGGTSTTTSNVFCNANKPLQITSLHNEMEIVYSSSKRQNNHFWLSWTTVGCGGELRREGPIEARVTDVQLKKEGEEIIECGWSVVAPVGKRIEMNVSTLLAFSTTCEEYGEKFTGLAIFDDSTNSSGVPIKRQCSKIDATLGNAVISQTSHGSEAYLHLRLKEKELPESINKVFFNGSIRFVDMPKDDLSCGGTINLSSDGLASSFHSPNYPNVYERGVYCQWEVIAPTGYQVELTLKEHIVAFEHPQKRPQIYPLGTNLNICSDQQMMINGGVSVYSGIEPVHVERHRNIKRNPLYESCRTMKEEKNIVTGNGTILVSFHGGNLLRDRMSGESDEGKKFGFLMEARAECGGIGIANEMRQEISVSNIAPNKSCSWIIKKPLDAAEGTKVFVSIDEAILGGFKWGENFDGERTRPLYRITVDSDEPIDNEFHSAIAHMPGEDIVSNKVYSADNQIKVEVTRGIMHEYFTMSYSMMKNTCGGELKSKSGLVEAPFYDEDFECIWTLRNVPGNNVSITIREIEMKSDEFCAQTYLEVRENNSTGPLIGRFCKEPEIPLTAENLWIKLKYQKGQVVSTDEEEEEEALEETKHKLLFRYEKWMGGLVRSRVIENPQMSRSYYNTWNIVVPADHDIKIHVEIMEVPEENPIRIFPEEINNNPSGELLKQLSGFTPQADFTIERNDITIFHRYYDSPEAKWRIRWEPVKRRGNDTEELDEGEKELFTCGSHLVASTLNQTLRYPDPPRPEGYATNQHCRWTIGRPRFSSLKLRIVDLSMEKSLQRVPTGESGEWEEVESEQQSGDCEFDYLAVASRGGGQEGNYREIDTTSEIESSMKFCRKDQKDATFDFAYSTYLILHFVSDRSRGGQGFVVEYTLGCSAFDFIPATAEGFSGEIMSPNYPLNYPDDKGCSWNVVFQSNRRVQIEIVDLDIEDSPDCASDKLVVASSAYTAMKKGKSSIFCGGLSKYNETIRKLVFPVGRVFLRFDADKQNNGRGFKLRISEILEECSDSVIAVDESTPNRTIHTPQWPSSVPASASCSWTLRAPSAHRLSFTVDPDHFELFNLADKNETNTCDKGDYLEVRDGSSFHSPLIGRYCGNEAPSTIFSTGSYLHIYLVTESNTNSKGFNATVALAQCGGTIVLREGQNTTLTSPNYPEAYPMHGNCTWTIRAPNTHFVETQLEHFFVQYSMNCTMDSLSIRDGNATAEPLMDHWCGNKYSQRGPLKQNDRTTFRSSKGIMTVEFIANSDIQRGSRMFCADRKCGFSLTLWASKIACGGDVTDSTGYLTTPGYPNRLLSRVECEWNLNAGPGKRYQLSLEFVDTHGYYIPATHSFHQQPCFGDVEVFGLPAEYELAHFALRQTFCQNITSIITPTDQAMIRYSDERARNYRRMTHVDISEENLYQPFRLHYSKVPADFDSNGCQILITDSEGSKNHTMKIGPPEEWQSGGYENPSHLFLCHISIRRSRKRKGTTSLSIKDFHFESPYEMNACGAYSAVVDMKAAKSNIYREEMIPFNEKICNSTFGKIPAEFGKIWNKATLLPEIDLFVISPRSYMGKFLEFTLDVEFDMCGGLISSHDGDSGLISSPGFLSGKDYEPNQQCQWIIEAPEGHVVQLRVKTMEIESTYICHKDRLIVSEGESATVVHRYCHNTQKNNNDTSLDSTSKQFTSASRIFVLDWQTDSTVQLKGWQIEYEFMRPNETGCGFTTNSEHGIIRSPGAPDNDYGNDLECIWDVQVPTGYVIVIHFKMMDIEKSTDCKNDALTIHEEHRGRGWAPNEYYYFIFDKLEMHSRKCDITAPPDITTESNRIRVNFTTNEAVVGRGFELEYKAVCGGVYKLSHGVLTSPHYPSHLPNEDMDCHYMISPEVPEGTTQVVTIAINDIQLPDTLVYYRRDPCASDYLQVIDAERQTVVYTYCPFDKEGEQKNLSFSVKGPVGIRMVANRTYVGGEKKLVRGFKITWALNRCGGEFSLNTPKTGYSTSFYSPGYPLDYHDELNCAWTFKTNPDRVFSVKIKLLDIENEDNCLLDRLEIHDGGVETNASLIGKYCGHSVPNTRIYVMNSTMLVRFVTDHSMSHSGFLMEVTATLGPTAGCGGNLDATGDWKTFSSPVVNTTTGVSEYPPDLRCGWTIKGLQNTILELKLTKMKTEKPTERELLQNGKKCLDFMAIYDGYKLYSPLIENDLCEHKEMVLPKIIHTSNRIAHVYFESDHSVQDEGFTMQYRSASPTCGGWLRATKEKQTIVYAVTRDPKEGQSYERCRWVIAANEQAPIWIRITTIKFPISNCAEDYVEIRDVGLVQECEHPGCALRHEHRKTVRECGVKGTGVAPFVSNTLAVQISSATEIIADSAATVNIEYYLLDNCNRTVDARFLGSSRVTSPHFPRPYGHNHSCETTIQVDDNKRIFLVFRAFDIEHPFTDYEDGQVTTECIHDYLMINDASKNKSDATKHCGVAIPHPFMSSGSIISLFLKTDESVVGEGYDISYYTADFIDEKTVIFTSTSELQGAIQQPEYPEYTSSASYKWFIHPPAGHKCKLSIEELDLNLRTGGADEKCGEDEKLTIILTLNDEKAESTLDSCSLPEEDTIPIEVEFSGEVVITFQSDAEKENDGRGFRVSWRCDDYESESV